MDFKPEIESASTAGQNLIQRLVRARIIAESGSSSSQEEKEGLASKRMHDPSIVSAGGDGRGKYFAQHQQCEDHPAVLLEYWCEDDCKLVCKDCLIFGDHKGHTAVTVQRR